MTDLEARLVAIQEQQVRQGERTAASLERQTKLLELIHDEQQQARHRIPAAITELQTNVAKMVDSSENWWRRTMWIAVGLVALASILGQTLDRALMLFSHLH